MKMFKYLWVSNSWAGLLIVAVGFIVSQDVIITHNIDFKSKTLWVDVVVELPKNWGKNHHDDSHKSSHRKDSKEPTKEGWILWTAFVLEDRGIFADGDCF